MRTFKRILSVTLAILMILGSWVFADVFASEKKEARLYETYGNGMLFQQNEDIVLPERVTAAVKSELSFIWAILRFKEV